MAGEDGDLGGHFPRLVPVGAAALAGILALGVLAHDHPVQVGARAVSEWGSGAAEDTRGPHVGVLLERLADLEAEGPEGDVVGDVWGGPRSQPC